MKTSIRSLTIAFTLAAASLLGTAAAHAQTVITTLPYTITSSGTYVLNNNLNGTQTSGDLITVNASNVTIDFQGHYIAGAVGNTGQTTYGIHGNEQSNVTVKNGTIAYCRYGIELDGNGSSTTNSVNHQIDNMRITYCYYIGIWMYYSPGARVTNCQVSQTGFSGTSACYGIVASGTGTNISNNVVITGTSSGTAYGIYMNTGNIARQNSVINYTTGIYGGKYQDNLTANCTTTYTGGTDAGGNN